MRRLFLHIGAHKTGTTALQQSLHQNRIRLQTSGASYVSAEPLAHVHAHLGNADPETFLPQGLIVQDPLALAGLMAKADQDVVIASSENFSFFFQRPAIAALEAALRPHFAEIRVVSYLRRQDRHAVSHHQEGAKPYRQSEGALWGHAPTALPAPSPAHALYLDYDRRLGLWADVFGAENLILRVYDRSLLQDGDIFADFLTAIGLDARRFASVGDRNTSLGAAQSKAGHLMNGLGIRPRVAEVILDRIGPGGRLAPSQAEARAFLEPYRASNRRLNDRFALSPLPDLFDDDFADYPAEPHSDWPEAGATAAFQAALGHLTEAIPALGALTADDLRLAATALQAKQPEAALRLIRAAHALRPTGPAIQKLKAELERPQKGP